jgi:hypothetical protein
VVTVRLPEGSASAVLVDGSQAGGRYVEAVAGRVTFSIGAGKMVELHYPLQEKTVDYLVGSPGRSLACRGAWRGETLMQVEPAGPYYPLYGRAADLPPVLPSLPQRPLIDSLAQRRRGTKMNAEGRGF